MAPGQRVRCEITNNRVTILGRYGGEGLADDAAAIALASSALLLTPARLRAVISALTRGRNLVRNARGRINQRGATSGTSLASGAFFLDGWASASSSNAVTWTGSDDAGRTLTIPSPSGTAKIIRQTIERRDIVAGDFILIWEGTASARVYNAGGSAPSLTAADASGRTALVVTLDGTDDVRVEFSSTTVSKTLVKAMLLQGTVDPGGFVDTPYADDLARCQRYYYRTPATTATDRPLCPPGFYVSTTALYLVIPLPVPMRAVPTLGSSTIGNMVARTGTGNNRTASAITLASNQVAGATHVVFEVTTAADTNGTPAVLRSTGAGAYLEFSAEL
jgi:hypothetical protein